MLFSPDFWPTFWTILGSGALLTVALCFVVMVIPASRTGQHHQPPARLHWHRTAPHHTDLPHAA